MAAVPIRCNYSLTKVWMVATLAFGASAFAGQGMQFKPIRTAALGSPPGTLGTRLDDDCSDGSCDVDFNVALGCWELRLPAGGVGVEIDLELQVFGWGMASGSPTLGAIQATVNPAGYSNGSGVDLNPKGWPASPSDGAYQANERCDFGGDLSPCTGPFDPTCGGNSNGFCVHAFDWVMPACANDLSAIATPTLDYAWATAAQNPCSVDDGQIKTLGNLILEIPAGATGTYIIDLDRDPNNSFMTAGEGQPIPGVVYTPACITLTCQSDADCDDGISCTTDICNAATLACENDLAQNACLIDGVCYVNGQDDPMGDCRACNPNLSQSNWSNKFAGVVCGDDLTDTDCNPADTCDGAGTCSINIQPDNSTCTDDGNECTRDFCSNGFCQHRRWPAGTPCGDPSASDCDSADSCNAFGSCISNQQPDGLACTDDGVECTQDVCNTGVCSHPPQPVGASCGDPADTPCDNPDSCDGAGTCLINTETAGVACGDPTDSDCDHSDACDGSGACVQNLEPVGTACGDPTDTACDGADTCDGTGSCLVNVLPDATPCPNGNFCDGAELCLGGVCQSADPPCNLVTGLCDEQNDECDLLGDFDGDLLVTQSDFSHWLDCETGPTGGPYLAGCEIFDFEQNGFTDLRDYARFQNAFTMP